MLTYHLSNAQRKELLVRGTPLAIALPTPIDDPPDWLAWARAALGDEGQYVSRRPEIISMAVGPRKSDAGLTSVIGGFVDALTEPFCWLVEVAIVELDPPTAPRHKRAKVQWPGSVQTKYGRWPKKEPIDAE